MQVNYQQDRPLGYFQQSISSATGLNSIGSVPVDSRLVIITVENAAVRWRDDGVAPTATVGYPLAIGAELRYTGAPSKLQLCPQSGSAIVNISYYSDK